ncbi:MAG: hypothetical protein KKA73_29065 [Chloroflexi bacterium]|nr:hypothetical protein [Chloroflexota bacterium]MBU1751746.1 hypothetical protein [Chloroflexota bacterium]MBU1879080.1 hypothetical protein [Chloroflexota bacterium]
MNEEQERERLRREDPIGEVRRETLAVYGVLGPGLSEDVYLRFLERGVWRRRPPSCVGDPQAGQRTGLARRLARLFGLDTADSD